MTRLNAKSRDNRFFRGRYALAILLTVPILAFAQLQPGEKVADLSVPPAPVFAQLGDVVLTQKDLDTYIEARIPAEDRAAVLRDPRRIARLVEQQLLIRLLANEGLKQRLHEDPDISAELYQSTMVILAERERERYIEANRLDDYRAQAKELAILQPDRVEPETTVSFRHFLVAASSERSVLQTTRLASELYEQLTSGEMTFAELVKEHSEDPDLAENDGFYTDVVLSELHPNMQSAFEDLEVGDISTPFRTTNGWHIVKLTERSEEQLSEDERMARYEEIAERDHLDDLRESYMRTLLDQPFEVQPGAVEELMSRYGVEVDDTEGYRASMQPARTD